MTKRQPTRCPSEFRPKIWPPDPGGACPGASGPHLEAIGDHFGAAVEPNDTVYEVKTGKTQVKGTPHVGRLDSVPRHGHRTPLVPILQPSGPVWGHFESVHHRCPNGLVFDGMPIFLLVVISQDIHSCPRQMSAMADPAVGPLMVSPLLHSAVKVVGS